MNQTTIDNKAERMALIQRFLNAETSVEEEKVLSGYFATHQPDDDEREVALLCNIIRNTFSFDEEDEGDLSGEAGKNGVVIIKTRKEDHIVYTINGKKATKIEVDKLAPNLIKNIIVMKKGSKAAVKFAGKKGGNQNDYISIELK